MTELDTYIVVKVCVSRTPRLGVGRRRVLQMCSRGVIKVLQRCSRGRYKV